VLVVGYGVVHRPVPGQAVVDGARPAVRRPGRRRTCPCRSRGLCGGRRRRRAPTPARPTSGTGWAGRRCRRSAASRRPDATVSRSPGNELEGGVEAGFHVLAHLAELLAGPGDIDAGQVVVGGPDQDQPPGAGMEGRAQMADPAPVGVVDGGERRMLPVGAGGDPSGDGRVQAVGAHDDPGPQRRSGRMPGDGPARPLPGPRTTAGHRPRSPRSARRRTLRRPRPAARRARSAADSTCRPRRPRPARCRTSAPGRRRR
jgi:hypothetical protein